MTGSRTKIRLPNGEDFDADNPAHLRYVFVHAHGIFDYLHPGVLRTEEARDMLAKLSAAWPAWRESFRRPILKLEPAVIGHHERGPVSAPVPARPFIRTRDED